MKWKIQEFLELSVYWILPIQCFCEYSYNIVSQKSGKNVFFAKSRGMEGGVFQDGKNQPSSPGPKLALKLYFCPWEGGEEGPFFLFGKRPHLFSSWFDRISTKKVLLFCILPFEIVLLRQIMEGSKSWVGGGVRVVSTRWSMTSTLNNPFSNAFNIVASP